MFLGDVDARDDRLEIDQLEQFLPDLDLIPEVDHARRHGAGDRRTHLSVTELALGVGQRNLQLLEFVAGVVEIFFADQLLFEKPLLTGELSFGLGDLALDLFQGAGLFVVLEP